MTKEIKKETDWLGREKDVIYEDGTKTGETRHETDWLGRPKDVTYDTHRDKISETKHETTLFGTSKEVTYNTHGNKVSETRYEERIFGGKKGVIYEEGKKIGELKTEKGVFGGRKQILHESYGKDVDLTRRVTREKPTKAKDSSWYSAGDYEAPTLSPKGESRKRNLDKIVGQDSGGRFHVYHYTSPEAIKSALDSGFYSGVTFIPRDYLCKYRCTLCGHEFDGIKNEYNLVKDDFVECIMGCSVGDGESSLLGLLKIIKGLVTGKEPFGYGKLIKSEKL